jgi:hypothetical protein
MFLAVFIICEAAAKPMKKDGPENELASDEVKESQNFHDHHHKEANKSHMNKMERKIQGKAKFHGSAAKHKCPKGQGLNKHGKCVGSHGTHIG